MHPMRLRYCVHHMNKKTLSDLLFMPGSMKLKIRSVGAFATLARWWQSKQVVHVQKSVTRLRKCHVAAAAGGNSGIASRMALLAVTTATDSRWCQFRLLHEGVLGGISAPSFPSPWILLYVTAVYSMDGRMARWPTWRMKN